MHTRHQRWLDITFGVSVVAIVVLVGIVMRAELRRPVVREQRIVEALRIVDRCESCHDVATHPGKLMASHPVEQFACTSCHGGQGLATNAHEAHRTQPDWERPLFTLLEREGNCGTCHLGQSVPAAPRLTEGRLAMAERGCHGCHEIRGLLAPPTIAPDLDGLAAKVTPAWLRAWLTDADALLPAHKMPRFQLSPKHVEALVAFLLSRPGPEIRPMPPDLEGDADRGKRAMAKRRCATCHQIEGRGGTFASALDTVGAKVDPTWLFNYLTDTHRIHPRTRMPGFRIPIPEAVDMVAYAGEQLVPDSAELPWAARAGEVNTSLAAEGKRLFADLGCRGCHALAGVPFTRVGMPLAEVAAKRIGDLAQGTKAKDIPDVPSWVAKKIQSSQVFDLPNTPPSKMPSFTLDETQAKAIGIAVYALKPATLSSLYLKDDNPPKNLPGGATGSLIDRFRCLVCHQVGGHGGTIARVPLDGAGARVRRPWLDEFLTKPVTVRMDQPERMPVLGMDEESARLLANWVEVDLTDERLLVAPEPNPDTVAQGRALYQASRCATCHVAEGAGTMKGPVLDGARDRLRFAYVYSMLKDGRAVVPHLRHPPETYRPEDALAMASYVYSLRGNPSHATE